MSLKTSNLRKNKKESGLHIESVLEFCQNGLDRAFKIGTVPPNSGGMVSLYLANVPTREHYCISKRIEDCDLNFETCLNKTARR